MKFSEFGLDDSLLEGLEAMGFEDATPIQEQSIPFLMAGKDILACAQTGTGKTAAYILPLLHHITQSKSPGIDTLILGPTRELVMQVDQQLEGFSYFTNTSVIAVYGGRDGHSMDQEKKALKAGADIVVATPGRFIAHLDLGNVDLSTVKHLVLDEADRMLDMGFAPDIMKIVHRMSRDRQTMLFSATMPSDIRRFAKELLRDPEEVSIAISKPAENIIQIAYEVEDIAKLKLAEYLLTGKKNLNRVLIFAGTKKMVAELARRLSKGGLKVEAIHSDLLQSEREERLLAFRNGTLPIVVATDVLSRGIDVKGIDLVLNFDVPSDPEDYVHRIGRTARAEASGIAITFINRKDFRNFDRIEALTGMKVRRQELPEILKSGASVRGQGGDRESGRGGGRGQGGGSRPQGQGQQEGQNKRKRPPRWKKKKTE
ncbi:MAG: DEAD/DEAH box helicase [Saprospirales bacterium]|nr:DEAD/DEAH box helicase [Saprospirales bacterium]